MRSALSAVVGGVLVLAGQAWAQPVVSPLGNTAVEGNTGLNTLVRDSGQPRTNQIRVPASELEPLSLPSPAANGAAEGASQLSTPTNGSARTLQWRVRAADLASMPAGTDIDQIFFRMNGGGSTWPPAGGAEFGNYEITLSQDATAGGTLSSTFAANQLNPVQVRKGRLVLPAGSLPGGAGPNQFLTPIRFDRPYTYRGGDLIITLTHDGADVSSAFVDAAATSADVRGATGFRALVADGVANTTPVTLLGRRGLRPGDQIESVQFRLDDGAPSFPPAGGATWADYEITLSEDATSGGTLSSTFADNQRNPLRVRDGALTIPAGGFPSTGTPSDWGVEIGFDRPYTYAGGDLIATFSHTGSNIGVNALLDAVSVAGRAITASAFNAPSGAGSTSVTVLRFNACDAPTTIAPLTAANVLTSNGAGVNTLLRNAGNPRTYQAQIPASQLRGIAPGDIITGLRLRNASVANPATWPPAGGATFGSYEITLARAANNIAAFSTSVAANMLEPRLVRSGPLFIPEGAFSNANADFPFEITFEPYTYRGGDLVVLITHTGSDIPSTFFNNAITESNTLGRAFGNSTFRASTVSDAFVDFAVLQFTSRPPLPRDTLFDGGSIVNRPFGGPGGADASVSPSPPENIFGFAVDGTFRMADDFPVHAPQGWRVDQIDVFAYETLAGTGPSTFTGANVNIWSGIPRAQGSQLLYTANQIASDVWTGAYRYLSNTLPGAQDDRPVRRVTLQLPAGAVLYPGEYWFDFAVLGGPLGGPFAPYVLNYCRGVAGNARQASDAGGAFGLTQIFVGGPPAQMPFRVRGQAIDCPGDWDFDGGVDFNDVLAFLNDYNAQNYRSDITRDGVTDFNDFLAFLNFFNTPC